jgi:hypothetical protein
MIMRRPKSKKEKPPAAAESIMLKLVQIGIFCALAQGFAPPLAAQADGPERIVSEIKVYTWNAKKGAWIEGQMIKIITETLDATGRRLTEELADDKGSLLEKARSDYRGRSQVTIFTGPDNVVRRTVTSERVGDTETETVVLPDGSMLSVIQKKYDAAGRLKETRQGGADGNLVFVKTHIYDKNGNLSTIDVDNPDGTTAFTIDYRYLSFDTRGRWLARAEYYTYADVKRRPHEIVYRHWVSIK